MNRLATEKSAYLRHAKDQLIDWYPWSDEPFDRAKREDKPVFLSSGAVWCHWCHVMARESFEDAEVARLLNEYFICVKLDRDERPDIDRRYQQAVALMGSGGGWPLSVFLTPERKPFYGGTYFPPEEAYGRPGFKTILSSISSLYGEKRGEIDAHGAMILERLKPGPSLAGEFSEPMIEEAARTIVAGHDRRNGGFGQAPKFPMSGAIEFLINRFFLTNDASLGKTVEKTLLAMARGGIHDQLGGGFHRYSTDEEWLIPHFEKMADDNAWLLRNYTDGYAVFGRPYFMEVARGIMKFFRDELSDPQGGFYASQDADVGPEDEGGYFTWQEGDLQAVLTETEYRALSLHLFHPRGSMHHDGSKKVLFIATPMKEVGKQLGLDQPVLADIVEKGKRKLLDARQTRPKPFIDRAIYTSLNGTVISAFLKAYRVLGVPDALEFALKSIEVIQDRYLQGGRLLHTEGIPGLLDDYIFFSDALISAYEVTGRAPYLNAAQKVMDVCIGQFWDSHEGGFFDTEGEVLGVRLKGAEDMPHPSANALAIPVLTKLSFMCESEKYRLLAEKSLKAFSRPAQMMGIHGAYYFCALDGYFNRFELSFNLSPSGLAKDALSLFYPYQAIRWGEDRGEIVPCRRDVCFEPVHGVEALAALLRPART